MGGSVDGEIDGHGIVIAENDLRSYDGTRMCGGARCCCA